MKENFAFFLMGILFLFLFSYFHFITPNILESNRFFMPHFGLEEIKTEKEFYSILGFPETKEFQDRKENFSKAFKTKQILDLIIFILIVLQIRIFRFLKEIKFLNSTFIYALVFFFYIFSFLQNNQILYLLSDRGIGTTEKAILSLNFLNAFYYGFHFLIYLFLSFLFWLTSEKGFFKIVSFCFLNSSFLLISGLYRIELMEFSYFFEKLGLIILILQNFFSYQRKGFKS